jgi:DNA-binding CsgD family transcriptional regulator
VKLSISPHTVHTHIKNIYEKLHAKDRQGALIAARKKGII